METAAEKPGQSTACYVRAVLDRQTELKGEIALLEQAEDEFRRLLRANSPKAVAHVAQANRRGRLLDAYREELFLLRRIDQLRSDQTAALVEVLTGRDLP